MFLPFVLTLYYITPRRFRNLTLFIVDLVFYAWGEPWLVILMLFSILLNYTSGILIGINREKKGLARFIFILSVILNLGLLGFFKYAGFIGETLNMVMPFLNIPILEIALPIGISYEDVAEQLMHRKETLQGFTDGVKLFLIGLSKKVLLANEMGNLWDAVRESGTQSGALGSWVGIIAYTFQIYFDFCGYSEMAMGLGKMFGFDFLKNFDYPYISKSITEFWRRWHISLGTWFREYVYIPLGGNRKGLYRQIINIAVVWFLTGLWHGASWNFILWGLYFGVLLMIEKLFMLKVLKKAPAIISHIYSIIIILFGWVLFYFENLNEMGIFLARMFGSDGFMMSGDISVKIISYIPLLIVSAITSTPLISKLYHKIKSKPILYVIDNAGCVLALLLCTAALVSSDYNPFLYYKF